MAFVSYAQNFEDVMLWRAFKGVAQGVYIDVGAQDPVIDSVSQAFHEAGWRGVHVEASTHYAGLLKAARPGDLVIQAAVSDGASVQPFFEIEGTGISTIDPEIAARHAANGFQVRETAVVGITLEMVFDACRSEIIHWLKLDIEGAERRALLSWGSNAHRPLVVVVESTLPMSQVESSDQWEHLLLERGYEPAYFDGLNRFYVVRERADLKAALSTPPNVFDGFSVSGLASSHIHATVEARWRGEAERSAAARAEAETRDAASTASLEACRQQLAALEGRHGETIRQVQTLAEQAAALTAALEDARQESASLQTGSDRALARAMLDAAEARLQLVDQHRRTLQEVQSEAIERIADTVRLADEAARLQTERAEQRIAASEQARQQALIEIRRLEGELGAWSERQAETAVALQAATQALRRSEDDAAHWRDQYQRATESLAVAQDRLSDAIQAGETLARTLRHEGDELRSQLGLAQEELRRQQAQAEADRGRAASAEQALNTRVRELEAAQTLELESLAQSHRDDQARRAAEVAALRQTLAQREAESRALAAELADAAHALQQLKETTAGRLLHWLGRFPEPAARGAASSDAATPPPPLSSARPPVPTPCSPEMPVLDKLLVLDDLEFVYAAYRTILKREPDPEGERNYVQLMRAGVDKIVVLAAMADSEEGRKAGVEIPGLAAARRRLRWSRLPVAGPLLGLLRPAPAHDPTRAFVSQSIGLHHAVRAMLGQVQASVEDVRQRQERMEATLRRLGERQDEVAAGMAMLHARIQHGGEPAPGTVVAPADVPSGADQPAAHDLRLDLLRKASAWKT
ncbi:MULTISPECIES: FkbM family methyltransferase [unclassified Rubrivivax]|uniref:FkbM family methyltransferase n=1 Tax=unclassified Rubrivivax TaxID=2649762 RepID=UPI001E344C76|nr:MULTISPECIES: FkbM family methyltransferase [unclassified Rubrivivax]MCC9595490.1 FkbM family methyltransferase [Rubrivivax sp. JA1055]MCC9647003.1 FkbM family methyltransferase [Rubrivivax sp. JA1029]